MARPKVEYDKNEVEEIIKMRLDEVSGIKKKLSPNSVWTLNKRLCKEVTINSNSKQPFNQYGYQFWCVDGYGKQRIDEIKSEDEFVLAGQAFVADMQDIFVLVDKLHKKPAELSNRLVKVFEKDRAEIKGLKEQNNDLEKSLQEAKDELDYFKKSFVSMFMESMNETNSLEDVISLKKTEDSIVVDELKSMFRDDFKNIAKPKEVENKPFDLASFRKTTSSKQKIASLEDELFGGK